LQSFFGAIAVGTDNRVTGRGQAIAAPIAAIDIIDIDSTPIGLQLQFILKAGIPAYRIGVTATVAIGIKQEAVAKGTVGLIGNPQGKDEVFIPIVRRKVPVHDGEVGVAFIIAGFHDISIAAVAAVAAVAQVTVYLGAGGLGIAVDRALASWLFRMDSAYR